jgi:hypothetical protein
LTNIGMTWQSFTVKSERLLQVLLLIDYDAFNNKTKNVVENNIKGGITEASDTNGAHEKYTLITLQSSALDLT